MAVCPAKFFAKVRVKRLRGGHAPVAQTCWIKFFKTVLQHGAGLL